MGTLTMHRLSLPVLGSCALVLLAVQGAAHLAVAGPQAVFRQVGLASWYGPGFHGRQTASGEIFDQDGLTAAHRKLPLGTEVKVTNLENGRSILVEINDRGPYVKGRVIDLSRAAARRLGILEEGLGKVRVEATPRQLAMAER
jgi:rare lipoprotein A (peptidoglycan hydrolase)